jgi:C-methyltransferase-like protein/putative zinc binding protein/methyltransferase family protein
MTLQDFYAKDSCRLCKGRDLEQVLELVATPPGNRVLREDELGEVMPSYPLELRFCRACSHVQLGHVVDPRILYQRSYSYVSATSPVFVAHLEDYADTMTRRFRLPENCLVADIGSNDGTCLRAFQKRGFQVLGIDPAVEIASRASEQGIETISDFFGVRMACRLLEERGPAHLITSHNALAHIDDLSDVFEGVSHWLHEDGLFVMEVGYFVDVLRNGWFDTIYHEHLDYHTVAPLPPFMERFGLEVIGVERIAPQGGSIRVIAKKRSGPHFSDGSLDRMLQLERDLSMDRADTVVAFGERIAGVRRGLGELLRGLKADGKAIAAFGAPTKATTLLMHFGLGRDVLEFTAEDNPLKFGCYIPGALVPIVPSQELYDRNPDYVVVLAWNFARPIIEKHARFHREGGRFILPMPEPRIIEDLDGYLLSRERENVQ